MISLLERFDGLFLNLEIPIDNHVKHRNTFNRFSDDICLVATFLDGQFRLRWVIQTHLPQDAKQITRLYQPKHFIFPSLSFIFEFIKSSHRLSVRF